VIVGYEVRCSRKEIEITRCGWFGPADHERKFIYGPPHYSVRPRFPYGVGSEQVISSEEFQHLVSLEEDERLAYVSQIVKERW
jgi:hypothetical protein